jgi:hypothetical protein
LRRNRAITDPVAAEATEELVLLQEPKYLRSTLGITIPETRNVGNWERQFYLKLREHYFPAKLAAPPGPDPEAPVLLFQSQHGHSQIVVSPSDLVLSVAYSSDWQTEPTKARDYVISRAQLVLELLKVIGEPSPLYWGVVTNVRIPWTASDDALLTYIARKLARFGDSRNYHDISSRLTEVVDSVFFSNVTIQNYRSWTSGPSIGNVLRLSRHRADERGVEINGDFNSRYAFNEDKSVAYTKESLARLIDDGMKRIVLATNFVKQEEGE